MERAATGTLGCGCIGLISCLFMGVTVVSLGFGALYPPLNQIAQPLLCPDGEMVSRSNVTNPMPGRTYISASWTCEDSSGVTPIDTFLVSLYAGTFYGLVLFGGLVALALVSALLRRGRASP